MAQRLDVVNKFKDQYIALQKQMASYAASMVASANKAQAAKEKIDSLKSSGSTKHYASGTDYSIGGLAITDEQGYEAKFAPTGGGKYTLMDEGTNIFTATQTANLKALSSIYNPQLDTLKQGLLLTASNVHLVKSGSVESTTVQISNVTLPNITNGDQAQLLIDNLVSIGSKARTKVK